MGSTPGGRLGRECDKQSIHNIMLNLECIRECTQQHTVVMHIGCALVTSDFPVAVQGVKYE